MRRQIAVVMCSAVIGLIALSSHATAQQKTVTACQQEWRANKAANQANGVTEKAYVTQCRGGSAPAQTTTAPAAPSAPTAATTQTAAGQKTAKACREEWRANKVANQASGVTESAYVAQCRGGAAPAQGAAAPTAPSAPAPAPTAAVPTAGQKTAKACRDEWRANKAANQANGVTEKAYVEQCRSGASPSQTTAPPPPPTAAPAPASTAAAPSAKPAPTQTSTAAPASTTPVTPAGANQFSTEAQAKAHCPTYTVVWVNLKSKIYHFSGTRYYGETKDGAYICERDAAAEGMRAAKNEKHP
jgi:hypothetical protein